MKNVLVVGKAGSGKDTAGDYLISEYGYKRVAFADPMKKIARELWPELDWTQKQRVRLQNFGSKIRDIDIDTWVKLAWYEIERCNLEGTPVVVTDCRYQNELDFFLMRGAVSIRIDASYTTRVERLTLRDGHCDEQALKHISEMALDGVRLQTLDNNGDRTQLYNQLDKFILV